MPEHTVNILWKNESEDFSLNPEMASLCIAMKANILKPI